MQFNNLVEIGSDAFDRKSFWESISLVIYVIFVEWVQRKYGGSTITHTISVPLTFSGRLSQQKDKHTNLLNAEVHQLTTFKSYIQFPLDNHPKI